MRKEAWDWFAVDGRAYIEWAGLRSRIWKDAGLSGKTPG